MHGDVQQATKLNVFDKLLDSFRPHSGLLRAENNTGTEDFEREPALARYAQDRPKLAASA